MMLSYESSLGTRFGLNKAGDGRSGSYNGQDLYTPHPGTRIPSRMMPASTPWEGGRGGHVGGRGRSASCAFRTAIVNGARWGVDARLQVLKAYAESSDGYSTMLRM